MGQVVFLVFFIPNLVITRLVPVWLHLAQQKNEEQAKTKQKSKPDNSVLEEKIFTNCIEDKMPTNPEQTYKVSILSICKRASENPTFWNKIWYDYLGQ